MHNLHTEEYIVYSSLQLAYLFLFYGVQDNTTKV